MPRRTKPDPTVVLGNGKVVHVSEYGWYQSTSQYEAHGCLFEAEAEEAWQLWDKFYHPKEAV
jgi:hypothetical protein